MRLVFFGSYIKIELPVNIARLCGSHSFVTGVLSLHHKAGAVLRVAVCMTAAYQGSGLFMRLNFVHGEDGLNSERFTALEFYL